jgi:uncharacterized membrane protein YbaN (DUF454 family)
MEHRNYKKYVKEYPDRRGVPRVKKAYRYMV